MDGLTDEERIEAWKSDWHPSFDGKAIVDRDFKFRSINPQWLEMLGVTPAEFLNKSFEDITPPEVRLLDVQNAKLTIEGKISSYLMHKEYHFPSGERRKVVLLVNRVPWDTSKPFQFFLSRIMLDEAKKVKESGSDTAFPESISTVVDFMMTYGKWLAAIGTVIGAIAVAIMSA